MIDFGSRSAAHLPSFHNIHCHLLYLHYLYTKSLPPPRCRYRYRSYAALDYLTTLTLDTSMAVSGTIGKIYIAGTANTESAKMLVPLREQRSRYLYLWLLSLVTAFGVTRIFTDFST
jgi:hypothetical protein